MTQVNSEMLFDFDKKRMITSSLLKGIKRSKSGNAFHVNGF